MDLGRERGKPDRAEHVARLGSARAGRRCVQGSTGVSRFKARGRTSYYKLVEVDGRQTPLALGRGAAPQLFPKG